MAKNRGFIDLEYRDEFNNPLFRIKRKRLDDGLNSFEKFCKEKLGITPFTTKDIKDIEKRLEEKYNLKGI